MPCHRSTVDSARDEQEILAHIANVVIEAYAIESALARAEKLAQTDNSRSALAADVVRVYASDAADRVTHDGKQVLNAITTRSVLPEALERVYAALLERKGVDTVCARRGIGDAAIQAGRYPF